MDGQHRAALPYANAMVRNAPELAMGHIILGDAFLGLELWHDALAAYESALGRSGIEDQKIFQKIWYCERKLGRYEEAYAAARKALSLYAVDLPYKELYEYGLTALAAHDNWEARMAFRFAALRVPEEDAEVTAKIRQALALFEGEEGAGEGFQ